MVVEDGPAGGDGKLKLLKEMASPSLLRYYELALDIALIIHSRTNYNPEAVRYALRDGSPQMGFNWLWQQHREIPRSKLVQVWQASIALRLSIDNHLRMLREQAGSDEEMENADPLPKKPLGAWRPLLKIIALHVREHVDPPTALAGGYKGVAHLSEAIAHTWALQVPPHVSLEDHADSFMCHCGDMGNEFLISDFRVPSVQSLVAPWHNREPDRIDVDAASSDVGGFADVGGVADDRSDVASFQSSQEMVGEALTPSPIFDFEFDRVAGALAASDS
jgi:hypothetical protein